MNPGRVLIQNAHRAYTFDAAGTIYDDAYLVLEGGEITHIGSGSAPAMASAEVIDASGKLVLPGLVNIHHHFFQNVVRAAPNVTGRLVAWMTAAYPLWAVIDEDSVHWAAQAATAELLLTGCTTVADFFYLFPRRQHHLLDVEVEAVRALGIRFHAIKGCTPGLGPDVAEALRHRGVDPADLVDTDDDAIRSSEQAIARYHDSSRNSMLMIGIGPLLPAWDKPALMRGLKDLADESGVLLHTHLHPLAPEVDYCAAEFEMTPLEYLASIGWLGENVYLAHASRHTAADINLLAATGTGVAHCPGCLLRLGGRVPPIHQMLRQDVPVGLGTDGGSSNDSASMLGELRTAFLLHRLEQLHPDLEPASWLSPEDVFRLGTVGGARVLGRQDIGVLQAGRAADLILIDLGHVQHAGMHDPLEGVLHATHTSARVDTTIVGGRVLVRGGQLVVGNEKAIVDGANEAGIRLANRARTLTMSAPQ